MNWRALETVRGLVAVPAEWRARLQSQHNTFSTAFLRQRATPAMSIPCPHGCGCAHQVVTHGDGDLVGLCRCESWGCEDIAVKESDVALWELNEGKLGRELAKALDLDSRTTNLGIDGVSQIGAFGRAALPVVLVIRGERDELRAAVVELVARLKERFIVLTPTNRQWDGRIKELLANAKAGLFDLESHISIDPQGRLHAKKKAPELFAPFLPAVEEPTPEDALRAALVLVMRLDSEEGLKPPTLITVFRLYCGECLTAEQVAARCGCSKGTVVGRLAMLKKQVGVEPEKLRAYSPVFAKVEESMTDSRAKNIRPGAMMEDEEDEENRND